MSNGLSKPSQRKIVKSALERIDALEQEFPRVIMAVNEALTGNGNRTEQLAAITEAVVELFGAEVVDAKIKEISERKTMKNLAEAKKALEDGVAKGDLTPAVAISEKSLVVGREIDPKGEIVFPGRVQLQFMGIRPEFQEKLKGQGPGFQVETQNGAKFEVLEIFDVVEKPEAEPVIDSAEAAVIAEGMEMVNKLEDSLAPSEA